MGNTQTVTIEFDEATKQLLAELDKVQTFIIPEVIFNGSGNPAPLVRKDEVIDILTKKYQEAAISSAPIFDATNTALN